MKVLQLVGFKNSGKTTIAKEIISHLTEKGLKVASLKHHGHGGIPEGIDNTDSEQHLQAGSQISGVLGEHILQLSHSVDWDVEQILAIYKQFQHDMLIVEGFKDLAYPKIILLRNQHDLTELQHLENIIGVVKPRNVMIDNCHKPIFDFKNIEEICGWVYQGYSEGKL